jgi:hypothetical protein
MKQISNCAALVLATVALSFAQDSQVYANEAGTVEVKNSSVPTAYSKEVSEQIERLRTFGDRFEKAIELIRLENAKPRWTWED